MHNSTPLITTIVGGLVLAFLFGMLANRLKISPLVGYLAAGVLAGPFTPGFVADTSLAPELAEIGVILLMFGVGLHFSLKDLLAVKSIAIPGAVLQIAVATLLGIGLSRLLDWDLAAGLVFGLCLSTASTVVLLRALEERQLIDSQRGQIAIGWLIVEDLVMVLTLVLLPAFSSMIESEHSSFGALGMELAITIGKVIAFMVLMMVVGRRLVPWILARTASTGSRELFTLAVLAPAATRQPDVDQHSQRDHRRSIGLGILGDFGVCAGVDSGQSRHGVRPVLWFGLRHGRPWRCGAGLRCRPDQHRIGVSDLRLPAAIGDSHRILTEY